VFLQGCADSPSSDSSGSGKKFKLVSQQFDGDMKVTFSCPSSKKNGNTGGKLGDVVPSPAAGQVLFRIDIGAVRFRQDETLTHTLSSNSTSTTSNGMILDVGRKKVVLFNSFEITGGASPPLSRKSSCASYSIPDFRGPDVVRGCLEEFFGSAVVQSGSSSDRSSVEKFQLKATTFEPAKDEEPESGMLSEVIYVDKTSAVLKKIVTETQMQLPSPPDQTPCSVHTEATDMSSIPTVPGADQFNPPSSWGECTDSGTPFPLPSPGSGSSSALVTTLWKCAGLTTHAAGGSPLPEPKEDRVSQELRRRYPIQQQPLSWCEMTRKRLRKRRITSGRMTRRRCSTSRYRFSTFTLLDDFCELVSSGTNECGVTN